MQDRVGIYEGVSYLSFLVPGLIMMGVIQNAFANSSSSLIQSKMNGNLVFLLLSPITSFQIFAAYTLAALIRGILVGGVVYAIALPFVDLPLENPSAIVLFSLVGSATLGAIGLLAGIWADKYEQLAAFQNFFILPLSFLSGVFYSIHALPGLWQGVSRFNPFFYMIDGIRFGFFGHSDVSPWISLTVTVGFLGIISALCLTLLHKGYKIRG